jgi:hypothetical protein
MKFTTFILENPDTGNKAISAKSIQRIQILWITASCLCFLPNILCAQDSTSAQQSTSPAVAVVQKAIGAMGGEGWEKVGASTIQSTVLYPNSASVKTTKNKRTDDWSTGANRHRLDAGNSTNSHTVIDLQKHSVLMADSKITKLVAANYDLVALAEVYPAVALRIGLTRRCQFQIISQSNTLNITPEKKGAVSMDCMAPSYPKQIAHFIWWFDSTGLPRQVQVPVLSMDGRFELYQTLQFYQYQQIGGLTVPYEIKTEIEGSLFKTESISKIEFQTSLSSKLFDIPSQQ